MTIETDLVTTIGALVSGRVYPDFAPAGATLPYVIYQQVGGSVINPIDGTDPGKENSRIQFGAWAETRSAANALMRQIEDAVRPAPLNGRPASALIARYDDGSHIRGAQQDFYFWW